MAVASAEIHYSAAEGFTRWTPCVIIIRWRQDEAGRALRIRTPHQLKVSSLRAERRYEYNCGVKSASRPSVWLFECISRCCAAACRIFNDGSEAEVDLFSYCCGRNRNRCAAALSLLAFSHHWSLSVTFQMKLSAAAT